MNKRGQNLMLAILIAVMIFIAGMVFVNYLMPEVSSARALDTGLNCTGTISDGAKVACLGVDLVVPMFIVIVISAAGGILAVKFLI